MRSSVVLKTAASAVMGFVIVFVVSWVMGARDRASIVGAVVVGLGFGLGELLRHRRGNQVRKTARPPGP
jgi:hypothetical protein